MQFDSTKKLLPFESVSEKNWWKRFPLAEIRYFFNYWPPSNSSNGFQKNLNEFISLPLSRKSVATGCNKDLVENIFPRDGKTASSREDIWGIGTKWFPIARMKDLLQSKFTLDRKRFNQK